MRSHNPHPPPNITAAPGTEPKKVADPFAGRTSTLRESRGGGRARAADPGAPRPPSASPSTPLAFRRPRRNASFMKPTPPASRPADRGAGWTRHAARAGQRGLDGGRATGGASGAGAGGGPRPARPPHHARRAHCRARSAPRRCPASQWRVSGGARRARPPRYGALGLGVGLGLGPATDAEGRASGAGAAGATGATSAVPLLPAPSAGRLRVIHGEDGDAATVGPTRPPARPRGVGTTPSPDSADPKSEPSPPSLAPPCPSPRPRPDTRPARLARTREAYRSPRPTP